MKKVTLTAIGLFVLLALGFGAASYLDEESVGTAPAAAQGQGNCLGGGATKIDNPGDTTTITAPGGQVITQVAIKAGTPCFIFNADGTQGCYTVSGIGTSTVTVTRSGSGPTCKEISHIEYVTGTAPPPPPPPPPTTTTTTTTTTTAAAP